MTRYIALFTAAIIAGSVGFDLVGGDALPLANRMAGVALLMLSGVLAWEA